MLLSIVLMVKNEEKNLGKCLDCLKPILEQLSSELIVLDTGSSDNTVEIAKKYTDKVFFSEWNNNFADMRNKSISYSKGEWLMILDADEFINNADTMIKFFKEGIYKKYNTAYILMKHYTKENKYTVSKLARLFKKDKDFKYTGAVHEQPLIKAPIYFIKTDISHYGYFSKDQELMDRKFTRNVSILEEELKEEPNNAYLWYQLSQSYGTYNKNQEGLEYALKAYQIAKENNESLIRMMYIYTNLALMYFQNKKFDELKAICEEALNLRSGYIDLYFYAGYAYKKLDLYKEAMESYEKYSELVNDYERAEDSKDTTITTYTADVYEHVFADLCFVYNKLGYYEKANLIIDKINQKDVIKLLIPIVVEAYILNKDYSKLVLFYNNKVANQEEEIKNIYFETIEKYSERLETQEQLSLWDEIKTISHEYGLLCELRIDLKNNLQLNNELLKKAEVLQYEKLPAFYGDAIFYMFKNKELSEGFFIPLRTGKWALYFSNIEEKHSDEFEELAKKYALSRMKNSEKYDIRFLKELYLFALTKATLNQEEYEQVFLRYLDIGIKLLNQTYNFQVIEEEQIENLKDDEEAFVLYLLKYKKADKSIEIQASYLRKALAIYPAMNRAIELLKEELENKAKGNNNTEIEKQKEQLKNTVKQLIENGLLEQATSILKEYEGLNPEDIDIYDIKAVIAMMEGKLELAEKILLEGIKINEKHFDLLYNLAYLYQMLGNKDKAVLYYEKSLEQTERQEDISAVNEALEQLGALSIKKKTNLELSQNANIIKNTLKISLCMIVKDEEKQLDNCLKSIKSYVDEIVIIDTGSTDMTKQIAFEYTNKVYDFKWCNDFARARNFSIEKASNDWVIVLDADEVVTKFNSVGIEQFIHKNQRTVGRLKRINPFEDGNEIKKHIERVNRLFNKRFYKYEGIIHEQIVAKDQKEYKTEPIEIELNHIGYMNEVVGKTNKIERNIQLLKEAIVSNPKDPYLHYQIGKSYFMKKDYNNSTICFEQALELETNLRLEYTQDLVESYGYSLLNNNYFEKALVIEKYKKNYSYSPDYNFLMGLIYMNNARFSEAIASFEECFKAKAGKLEGINTFLPSYNIGVIYEVLGEKEKAIEFFKRYDNYEPSQKRLSVIMS